MTRLSAVCVGSFRRPSGTEPSPHPCFDGVFPAVGTVVFARTDDLEPQHAEVHRAPPNPEAPIGLQPFGAIRDADSYDPSLHYQSVWREGAPLYVAVSRAEAERRLLELVDRYWDLAHAEGKEGRDHDTLAGDAQRTRQRIEETIRLLG